MDGRVYTIEGNSGDKVARKSYDLDSEDIRGYINCQAQAEGAANNKVGQEFNASTVKDILKNATYNYNVDTMLADMSDMIGLSENNAADAAQINAVTGQSDIDCQTTPWCAAFAMNELESHGVLDTSTCPNVNYCPSVENWSKEQGTWETQGNGYVPSAGDAVMFDWDGDGTADHIGVVERIEDGKVYTIEGNSGDQVARKSYDLDSENISGYINCKAQGEDKTDKVLGGSGNEKISENSTSAADGEAKEAANSGGNINDNPTLENMKKQISEEYGISPDEVKVISAGSKDDKITVTSNSNGEVVIDINGTKTTYSKEDAQKLIIDGGSGNDTITVDVSVKADMHIAGGSGNDYIQAGGGNDTIYGGSGNDTVYGMSGDDVIFGGKGKDYIDGGRGNDVLYGGKGEDNLIGGKDNDKMYGGADDDLLIGASGSDYASGQGGSDRVIADAGDDVTSDSGDPEILQLETVDVPDNFIVEGDATEKERIESDLEFLASTENGQKMFEEIAATQHTVTIQATSGGSNCSINPAAASSESGCDSTIHYNMTKIKLSGSENWIERAPVVSLFHEMCHSYNAAKGNMNINYYDQTSGAQASNSTLSDVHSSVDSTNGSVGGFEWQAVGIDNANIEANPDLLTENGLRSLLGYNRRERYY